MKERDGLGLMPQRMCVEKGSQRSFVPQLKISVWEVKFSPGVIIIQFKKVEPCQGLSSQGNGERLGLVRAFTVVRASRWHSWGLVKESPKCELNLAILLRQKSLSGCWQGT